MEWLTCIKDAIDYMENNLLTISGPENVAKHMGVSTMYLQRGFQIMTGYTIGEYIRNRRLYLAALRLAEDGGKIIDTALEYGYDTPESFAKAFMRFHGATPSEIRKNKKHIRTFLPFKVSITVQGGCAVEYTVEKMSSFKVIGFSREFLFDTSYEEIPKFWDEMNEKYGKSAYGEIFPKSKIEQAVHDNRIGEYGICIDDVGRDGKFRYMIAGRYLNGDVPKGMKIYEIPAALFAKFGCVGDSMQTVNTYIWNEWLPANKEYEFDGNFNVECYCNLGNVQKYDYRSEIWIPVRQRN